MMGPRIESAGTEGDSLIESVSKRRPVAAAVILGFCGFTQSPRLIEELAASVSAAGTELKQSVIKTDGVARSQTRWSETIEVTSAPPPPRPGLANAYLIPVLAADSEGTLHLLTARGYGLSVMENEAAEGIQHWVFVDDKWRLAGEIGISRRLVSSISAVTGHDGHVYVLWGDVGGVDSPFKGAQVHLTWLADGLWRGPQVISDDAAQPWSFWGDSDALVEDSGNMHGFWTDARERHTFLPGLDPVEFHKTFHRVRYEVIWGEARRLQRRGTFSANEPRVAQDAQGIIHLFWSEERTYLIRRGRGDVFHSELRHGKWSKSEQVSDNRNHDDTPGAITYLQAARGPLGAIYVGWTGLRFADRSRRESVLEFKSLANGRWSEGTVLSRRSGKFVWVKGQNKLAGIVFQEYPASSIHLEERSGFALYYMPVTDKGFGEKELIASDTAEELFDAVVDAKGNQHCVFIQPGTDKRMHLLHRVLTLQRE